MTNNWPQSPLVPSGPAWPAPVCPAAPCRNRTLIMSICSWLWQKKTLSCWLNMRLYVSSCSCRLFSWSVPLSFSCSALSLSCSKMTFWFKLHRSQWQNEHRVAYVNKRMRHLLMCHLTPAALWCASPCCPIHLSDCWSASDGPLCETGSASPQYPEHIPAHGYMLPWTNGHQIANLKTLSLVAQYLDFISRLDLIVLLHGFNFLWRETFMTVTECKHVKTNFLFQKFV